MIIDGHAHLGGEYKNLETILSTLERTGVDKVVLCPADSQRQEAFPIPDIAGKLPDKELNFVVNRLIRSASLKAQHQINIDTGNTGIFDISGKSGGRIFQFFWANPLKESIIEEIETKLNVWRFKGIKLHQGCHPFKIKSSHFNNIAEFAVSKSLPLFIHLYSKKEVMDFISVSGNYKTTFIIGHLIGLEIFIQERKKISNNTYFDISCPPLVSSDRIKKAINQFGPEKILMGSDTPYGKNNLKLILSRIRSLNLPARACEMILGNNMRNILMI